MMNTMERKKSAKTKVKNKAKPRTEMDGVLVRAREAYEGRYQEEIQELLGLSVVEIAALMPHLADPDLYEVLVSVVMDASRRDLPEEALRGRIDALGQGVVGIARLVRTLSRRLGWDQE